MEDIILIGGGGQCKATIDVIETEKRFRIAGIVDLPGTSGEEILGYRIFATDDDLPRLVKEFRYFMVTVGQIGNPEKRRMIFEKLITLGVQIPVIISPYAYVSKHAVIESGTVIQHAAVVNAGAFIGKNCIINSRALVEHDARIGHHCHISTGAIINGGVTVGDGSFVGSGAVTKQYVTIPAGSFIKAGSLYKG